ncbi:MAG: hypothetical protein JSU92_06580 [Deltaproteobacteria bacterium]|nr:MAG: hypothetical protein JSU92_06580 [Deltaproteobacteria bacterium]
MDKRNYSRREFWKGLFKRFSLLLLGTASIKQSGRTGLKEAQFYKRGDRWAG